MKCELCHKATAEVAIRKKVKGEDQELYVCKTCADEVARQEVAARTQAVAGTPEPEAAGAAQALPLMGIILDAAFEIVGRAMNVSEPKCPDCGITRAEYRKASRLGCPACYEAFAKDLEAAVLELHRCLQHVGKSPAKARTAWQLQQFKNELEEAVKNQRYEEAIALRDKIRKLGGAEAGEGGQPSC